MGNQASTIPPNNQYDLTCLVDRLSTLKNKPQVSGNDMKQSLVQCGRRANPNDPNSQLEGFNVMDSNEWTTTNIFWMIVILVVLYLAWNEYNRVNYNV